MLFATLLTLACATCAVARLQSPIPALRGALEFPQITGLPTFAGLHVRQGAECPAATETVCPDGNGCCPSGSPCAYTTVDGDVYGVCDVVCGIGAVTCTTPFTACCEAGEICGDGGTCLLGYSATSATDLIPSITVTDSFDSTDTPSATGTESLSDMLTSIDDYLSSVIASLSSDGTIPDTSTSYDLSSAESAVSEAAASASSILSDILASASSQLASASDRASAASSNAAAAASSATADASSTASGGGATSDGSRPGGRCAGLGAFVLAVVLPAIF